MAYKRTNISFFELSNPAYASATVTFFQVDPTTNARLTTLITLYADTSSSTTLANPYSLDSDGKFGVPAYALERFIAVINDANGDTLETGVWEPALSNADVTAAAASAAAAASSETAAALSATAASISAVAAAASAALAAASVGTVSVTSTDTTTANLNTKLTVSAPLTKTVNNPAGAATLDLGVTVASSAQVLAKASNSVILTPGSLAFLDGDTVTSGLVRLATVAEATTGTISTAAVTPAGLSAAVSNTVTMVQALAGAYTNVSSGANVTMTANVRYRFTATTAAQVNFPTTMAANSFNIIENAYTTGATMTRYGDIILYSCTTAATAMRSQYIGTLPQLT